MNLLDATEKLRRDRGLIEGLIEDPSRLGPDFQPVRRLADDGVVGWKATGSGQAGTDLDSTLALLESAQTIGLVERLDWAFRVLALDAFATAGLEGDLYITPEPETYNSPCPPRLAARFSSGRRAVRVAAEIPASSLGGGAAFADAVAEFRGWGWRLVVADVADELAAEPGLLDRLAALRPDVLKLELSRPGRSAPAQGPVAELLGWAAGAGVEVMALGVDDQRARDVAVALGATTGRGRLLGEAARLG